MKKLTLILFLAVTSIFSQEIDDNLLVHYSFNGNTDDNSGNMYNAINNGVTFIEDRFGNPNSAGYFDGVDDYLELPNISELKPDFPISFSFWIRYDSANPIHRDVFNTSFEEDRNTGVYFNSQISTGNFAINYGDGSYNYTSSSRRTYVSDQSIEINNWHNVVIVMNSSDDMQIYIDCIESDGTYSGFGGDLVYSDSAGNIGRHDRDLGIPANYFMGAIDEFRYWDRALTSNDIAFFCNNLAINSVQTADFDLKIYPNPSGGKFHIKTNVNFSQILLYNNLGQQLLALPFSESMDLNNYPKGSYTAIFVGENRTVSRKIILY